MDQNLELLQLINLAESRPNHKEWRNRIMEVFGKMDVRTKKNVKCFIGGKSEVELRICKQMNIGDADVLIYPSNSTLLEESLEFHTQFPSHLYVVAEKVRWRLRKLRPLVNDAFLSTAVLNDFPRSLFGNMGDIFREQTSVTSALNTSFSVSAKPVLNKQTSSRNYVATGTHPKERSYLKDVMQNCAEYENAENIEILHSESENNVHLSENSLNDEEVYTNLDFDNSLFFYDLKETEQEQIGVAPTKGQVAEKTACSDECTDNLASKVYRCEKGKKSSTNNDVNYTEEFQENLTLQEQNMSSDIRCKDEKSLPKCNITFPEDCTENSSQQEGIKSVAENESTYPEDGTVVYAIPPSNSLTYQSAFSCEGWPRVALEWYSRDRKWPDLHVIHKIVNGGFHVIAKSPPHGYDFNKDYCLLFAEAELLLTSEMTMMQRQCYTALKLIQEAVLHTTNHALSPYHMKTVLFWVSEQTTSDFWRDDIKSGIKTCLKYLMTSLQNAFLSHFFIPEFNLISYIDRESLNILYIKTREAYKNPSLPMKRRIYSKSQKKSVLPGHCSHDRHSSANGMDTATQLPPNQSMEKPPSTRDNFSEETHFFVPSNHQKGMCPSEAFFVQAIKSGVESERGKFAHEYEKVTEEILDALSNKNSETPAASDLHEILLIFQTWRINHNFSDSDFKQNFKCCFQTVYNLSILHVHESARQQIAKGMLKTIKIADYFFVNHKKELLTKGAESVVNRLDQQGDYNLYHSMLEGVDVSKLQCVLS